MSQKVVFISSKIPEAGLALLKQDGYQVIEWDSERRINKEELIAHCKDAHALLNARSTQLDEEFFKACSHLEIVSLLSAGYDHVDLAAANNYRVPVTNTPGVLSKATADTAFLLMMAASRKAFFQHKKIINGKWQKNLPTDLLGIELRGKTLGIFGLGQIGLEMGRMCKRALDMEIIYHNRTRNEAAEEILDATWVSFDELLDRSDVISVHSALTADTKGRFNKDVFYRMKSNAIFINTSRGAVHNEMDLISVLEEKRIWGAGLDVTNPEPMSPDNPLLFMENVAVLPHIGSATVETRNEMSLLAAKNIIARFNDEVLLTCLNPEVLEVT